MTGIMIGLGVWGVLAASRQYSDDKQNQAQVRGLRRAKGEGDEGGERGREIQAAGPAVQAGITHAALSAGIEIFVDIMITADR